MKLSWSSTWLLKFHPDECKVLTIGYLDKIEQPRVYLYEQESIVLEHVSEQKDLGIYIDEKLRFDFHLQDKINKANSLLGLIRRTFTCVSREVLIPLYTSLVRHYVEYGGVFWSGIANRAQIRAVEKIQMRARFHWLKGCRIWIMGSNFSRLG